VKRWVRLDLGVGFVVLVVVVVVEVVGEEWSSGCMMLL
jgi:hypothetical protein